METLKFGIVTPCYNCASTIDETVHSVISQIGDFELHYHVQDGASNDRTLSKLVRWEKLINSGLFPVWHNKIRFTFSSFPDSGMYEAINRGFQSIGNSVHAMTWINGDDRLLPGAVQTAAIIFSENPNIKWLGGRHCYFDRHGCPTVILDVRPYSRRLLELGLYEGRRLFFLQQEGTFWKASLWRLIGSLVDDSLKLSADFDLWRRFAHHTEYLSVNTALGSFRVHDNQATRTLDSYYAEIDDRLSHISNQRDKAWDDFLTGALEADNLQGPVATYDGALKSWRIEFRQINSNVSTTSSFFSEICRRGLSRIFKVR
jgi:glycosyltransferase involved in cell wall biosynthesis